MRFNTFLILIFFTINALSAGTYFKPPALIEGFTTVASAAGTTTLTRASETKLIITGATTQTVVLPDATTMSTELGRRFYIINKSSGTVTVNASGGGLLGTIAGGAQAEIHLRAAGSAAGTWDLLSSSAGGGGTWGSITGTLSAQTDLQSALDLKAPLASPTFSGTITTPLTANRALVTGASGVLSASATTDTQIGYLSTLSSNAQTQLDAKQARSTLTTKGDLYVATASATVARQGVGSDGTFLKADSGQTNGVTWASVAGSALSVVAKTTTYTATTSDDVITVSTAAPWTLSLYAVSGNSGKVLRVVKTSSDTNALTIDGNASETINGSTTVRLTYQYDEVTLICNGTSWNIYAQVRNPTFQIFTSGTVATYTTPPTVKYLIVKMVGGGGGGGGSSSASANNGGSGSSSANNSIFAVAGGAAILTATNGIGAGAASSGGAGGTATISAPAITILSFTGAMGGNGTATQDGLSYPTPGAGGSSFYGGAGAAGYAGGAGNSAVVNSGSGGGGGAVTSTTTLARSGSGGGAGAYLEALIPNPSATYDYTVGGVGTGGTAGTGGNAGATGAAGKITIEEHYQ